MRYKELDCYLKTKDVDLSKRIVTGYFSAFDNIDHDMDVIRKGAFKKSISERGANSVGKAKIKHLLFHDFTKIVGVPHVLKEDDLGLYFETKMPDTTDGNDTLIKYQEGIYDNHSVGFSYVEDKIQRITKEDSRFMQILQTVANPDVALEVGYFYEIKEVKLYEGSTVGIGANESTPFLNVKNFDKNLLNNKLDLLISHLKNGNSSDMSMMDIEANICQIKNFIAKFDAMEDKQSVALQPDPNEYILYL